MALTAGSVDANVSNTVTTLQDGDWFLVDRAGTANRITALNAAVDLKSRSDDAIDIDISTSTASASYDIPSTWKGFRILISRFDPATNDAFLAMQVGENGAAGAFETGTVYVSHAVGGTGSTASSSTKTTNGFDLTTTTRTATADESTVAMSFFGMNEAGRRVKGTGTAGGINSSGDNISLARYSRLAATGNYNAITLFANSGNISNLQARIERAL